MTAILDIREWLYSMGVGSAPVGVHLRYFPRPGGPLRARNHPRIPVARQLSYFIHYTHPQGEVGLTLLFMFATISIGWMLGYTRLILGTKSRILEDMYVS
jgi:hypothetical protein